MIENGIKPVYVFDGKPPTMKSGELEKRMEKRADAQVALEKAKEEGNDEEIDKQSRRLVKVSKDHVEDCKKLLKLMGVPYVQAPCEAESQCAEVGCCLLINFFCEINYTIFFLNNSLSGREKFTPLELRIWMP